MNTKTLFRSAMALALLGAATAQAQQSSACPQLPADSGLSWVDQRTGDIELCRAIRPDGSEAFGLMISSKPTFEPQRGDRAERGRIDGHDVYWYRAELALKPGTEARETLLQLADGRSVHVWLQAPSSQALDAGFGLVSGMHFDNGERVAGQ
jgi:hypothetical protein